MNVRFRVLGPAEVYVDGEPVPIQGGRLLTVLAGLLLRANRAVSVEQLIRWLWEDTDLDQQRARSTVQEYVRRLRRVIGSDDLIHTTAGGYLVRADEDSLDLLRFGALTVRGRTALDAGDLEAAAELLTEGLDLWHGPALSNVNSAALREDEGTLLAEQRLQVCELWVEALLGLGQHEQVIPELRRLTKEHPWREKFAEQLMVALYRHGRQAEALSAYDEIRRALSEDLGIDPGASIRAVHRAILAGEPLSEDRIARVQPVLAAHPPRQLPIAPATFIGRAVEWEMVTRALAVADRYVPPVVAFHGPGGVGKSALALRAAHMVSDHYPDGQLYVDLQGASPGVDPLSPLDVLRRFMLALGVAASAVPANTEEAAARFRSALGDRRMLLLLDNAADTAQVRPLLPANAGCAVLITSRSILSALGDATHIGLSVLHPAESLNLLTHLDLTGRVGADPALAGRLADLCGHLPLALRITAARIASRPDWPLLTFAERLDDEQHRLDHLGHDNLSVRACFQASYQALINGGPVDQAAARAFRMLGLPNGPDISLPIAARLLDLPEPAAERVLERLVDAQLGQSPNPGRYRMHDLVRLYAREVAEREIPEPQRQLALARSWRCYLATTVQAGQLVRPGYRKDRVTIDPADALALDGYPKATAWLAEESHNLLAAARQAAGATGAIPMITVWLTQALFVCMSFNAHYIDLTELNTLALDIARARRDRFAEGQIMNDLGSMAWRAGDGEEAIRLQNVSLEIRREIGDHTGEAMSVYSLGNFHLERGEYVAAQQCLEQALTKSREVGYRTGEALALNALGEVNLHLGDADVALDQHRRSVRIHQDLGDRLGEAIALVSLGDTLLRNARFAEAISSYQRARAVSSHAPASAVAVWTLAQQGEAHRRAGDLRSAARVCEQALELSNRVGLKQEHGQVLWRLGSALADLGEIERARECWREALPIFERLGVPSAEDVRRLLEN